MYKRLITAAIVAALAMPAVAGNWTIAASEILPDGGGDLKGQSWQFFLRTLGPGDHFGVLNATDVGQVAAIAVPDEPRFESPKRRAKTFARENGRIAVFFDSITEDAAKTDILESLRHVALNRVDPDRPLDLMIVGSVVQTFDDLVGLSMDQDGVLYVPSPDHLTASIADTGYGIGAEGADGLQNVYLHMCPVADDLRADEVAALQGFYTNYVAQRGGTLVTWSDDLPTCFERLAAEVRTPLEIAPYLDAKGALEMIRVGAPVAEIIVEADPTTLVVNGIEVDQFNLFAAAAHPSLLGVDVTTGVVYEPGNYPAEYESAYCYFTLTKSDSQLRFDLATKQQGHSPVWQTVSQRSLDAAGIDVADFEAGKPACQWPED